MKEKRKCSIEGCNKSHHAKGYCSSHFLTYKHRGLIEGYKTCSVINCNFTVYAKGLCHKDYVRFLRNKTLEYKRPHIEKCSVPECSNSKPFIRGYCIFHYDRFINKIPLDLPKHYEWGNGKSEYKRHSEMKRIRLIVLKRDNYICVYCGNPTKQIHHKDGSKDNHKEENLVACCQSCNSKRGKPRKIYNSKYRNYYGFILSELKTFGIKYQDIRI